MTAFRIGALVTATRLRSERTPIVLGLSVLLAALFSYQACWDLQSRAAVAELNTAHDEFAAAHELLKKAPETTPAIRAELAQAEAQFVFFAAALRALKPGLPDARGMANVFTTSERILQTMDGVTGMFSKQGLPA